jgi:hypothetical protein
MQHFVFEDVDPDRPHFVRRSNPLRIRGRSYLYKGPRGPVEVTISGDGTATSLTGPEIGAVEVPWGPAGPSQRSDAGEGGDPRRDGIAVPIGADEVNFSLTYGRMLPVVRVATGWASWRARRISTFFRWSMVDEQTGKPVAVASAWRGKIQDGPGLCEVGVLVIIWAAFLGELFEVGPLSDVDFPIDIPPAG